MIGKHNENNETKIEYADVLNALDATLNDLCEGRLPLGGSVNRGHGIFNGFKAEQL